MCIHNATTPNIPRKYFLPFVAAWNPFTFLAAEKGGRDKLIVEKVRPGKLCTENRKES